MSREFPIPRPCKDCGVISDCVGGICQNKKCPGKTSAERFGYELLRALDMVSGSPDGSNGSFDLVGMPDPSGWKIGDNSPIFKGVIYVSARDLARDVLIELEVRDEKNATDRAKLVAEIDRLRVALDRLDRERRLDRIQAESRRRSDMIEAIGPRMARFVR